MFASDVKAGKVCVDADTLAVVIITGSMDKIAKTSANVYLYSTATTEMHWIAEGNRVQWSPSGRYLAAIVYFDGVSARHGAGNISRFTIWDTVHDTYHTREYAYGNILSWSPDERYLVATGFVSSGMSGGTSWVDIFDGDGSGATKARHFAPENWLLGQEDWVSFVEWTAENELLLFYDLDGSAHDTYYRVNLETGERTPISLPERTPPSPPSVSKLNPTDFTLNVISPDGRFSASVPDDHFNLWEILTPTLNITDLKTKSVYRVPLPEDTLDVQWMAWQPCTAPIEAERTG